MRELLRAAFVIARRDFTAIILSKAFILFLLGPLFPVAVGAAFGGLGDKISSDAMRPAIGIALPKAEAEAMEKAHARLTVRLGPNALSPIKRLSPDSDPRAILSRPNAGVVAVVSGSVDHPRLTGDARALDRAERDVSLIASAVKAREILPEVKVERQLFDGGHGAAETQGRQITARAAQGLIFLLTMLLAGMVLSNMVEEKTNKVIEILAAAVPVDAVFLGKLGAMLGMSFVGILFWGAGAAAVIGLLSDGGSALPQPAVGWPLFILLGVLYFAMAYLLLGSLFLGIGAQAQTVREVQTLNMPVTMGQLMVFFLAVSGVDKPGSGLELFSCILPFSSPFAMIARAATDEAIWPHLVALVWQIAWVAIIIRVGVWLFRRHVLKSGSSTKARKRAGLFRRGTA